MSKTDRELLKLAAKAACYEVARVADDGRSLMLVGVQEPWNSLDDDGDALRLAIQCGIEVSVIDDEPGRDGRSSRACAGYSSEIDPRVRYVFEDHRGDLFAATRRAIVRAAASIGEKK